jgi:hypothetical protein
MPSFPKLSEHGGELFLLGMIAAGVLTLLGIIVWPFGGPIEGAKQTIIDMTPFLLLLQSIVSAIKDRWTARLQGQSNQLLGAATPGATPSATEQAKGQPGEAE